MAYGFDKIGLSTPPPLERPEYHIEWIRYGNSDIPQEVTGLIFPSGIFERVEYRNSWQGHRAADVRFDRGSLLGLERHMTNLLQAGGWVAILAREIVDEFPDGTDYGSFRSDDTDLAKRVLTGLGVRFTRRPEGTGMVVSKRDEFGPYIKRWGIARTYFELDDGGRVLAKAGDAVVGFERGARLFVLPFDSSTNSVEESRAIAQSLASAVIDYRRKVLVELPAWVSEFQFFGEQKLRDELSVLQEREIQVTSGLRSWEERKIIIVNSGTALKDALVEILKNFFMAQVDPLDEGREDFKILAAETVVAVGEAKGTNAGIKREHVNQVDSHRERLGLTDVVPGLLLINNQMDVSGITRRQATQVSPEQVRHARRMNILIVRTIDLLYLMRHLEDDAGRGAKLLALIRGGGGWLAADPSGYRIVTGE